MFLLYIPVQYMYGTKFCTFSLRFLYCTVDKKCFMSVRIVRGEPCAAEKGNLNVVQLRPKEQDRRYISRDAQIKAVTLFTVHHCTILAKTLRKKSRNN